MIVDLLLTHGFHYYRQIFLEGELVLAMKKYILEEKGEDAFQLWLKENDTWYKGMQDNSFSLRKFFSNSHSHQLTMLIPYSRPTAVASSKEKRNDGHLKKFGMPPTRSKGNTASTSKVRRIRTEMLEAVDSSSSTTISPLPVLSETHVLDFSCKKGCLIAVMAALELSDNYGFWLAETLHDITRPMSESDSKEMEIELYYFSAVAGTTLT